MREYLKFYITAGSSAGAWAPDVGTPPKEVALAIAWPARGVDRPEGRHFHRQLDRPPAERTRCWPHPAEYRSLQRPGPRFEEMAPGPLAQRAPGADRRYLSTAIEVLKN